MIKLLITSSILLMLVACQTREELNLPAARINLETVSHEEAVQA